MRFLLLSLMSLTNLSCWEIKEMLLCSPAEDVEKKPTVLSYTFKDTLPVQNRKPHEQWENAILVWIYLITLEFFSII